MRVSVVVPTLGRTDTLGEVLEGLCRQQARPDEVVVIDQNGDRNLAPLYDRMRSLPLRVQYSPGPLGCGAARNQGLESCTGDIVLFLDDDVTFGDDLIAEHRCAFERYGADGVAGAVWKEGGPPAAAPGWNPDVDPVWQLFLRPHVSYPMMALGLSTGNLSVKRALLHRLGGFDERFEHGRGGEHDLAIRAWRAGAFLVYHPPAAVVHQDPLLGGRRQHRAVAAGSGYMTRLLAPQPEPQTLYLYLKHFPGSGFRGRVFFELFRILRARSARDLARVPLGLLRLYASVRAARRMLTHGAGHHHNGRRGDHE